MHSLQLHTFITQLYTIDSVEHIYPLRHSGALFYIILSLTHKFCKYVIKVVLKNEQITRTPQVRINKIDNMVNKTLCFRLVKCIISYS